jgi:hypothetical protein
MNRQEVQTEIKKQNSLPTPYAYKCSITSYSTATLDEIVAFLLIDTPDKVRHTYGVPFDPLMAGKSYNFYMVNVCSSGVIPETIQWATATRVHVLGEQKDREVPLRYEKRNWPTALVPMFGPSQFIWTGIGECKWQ